MQSIAAAWKWLCLQMRRHPALVLTRVLPWALLFAGLKFTVSKPWLRWLGFALIAADILVAVALPRLHKRLDRLTRKVPAFARVALLVLVCAAVTPWLRWFVLLSVVAGFLVAAVLQRLERSDRPAAQLDLGLRD